MVIFSRFDHVWIHEPISLFSLRRTFPHFSHKLQYWTSKTFHCFGANERPKITYQPYPGRCTICTSVIVVFYHMALKIQSPVRGVHLHSPEVHSREVHSLNGILLLTNDTKRNKSICDMKQSVVSIGSQYTSIGIIVRPLTPRPF